ACVLGQHALTGLIPRRRIHILGEIERGRVITQVDISRATAYEDALLQFAPITVGPSYTIAALPGKAAIAPSSMVVERGTLGNPHPVPHPQRMVRGIVARARSTLPGEVDCRRRVAWVNPRVIRICLGPWIPVCIHPRLVFDEWIEVRRVIDM